MKEFTSQTGGRYTYVDDLINLQDLSLAFAAIFDECDNFILTGCQVSGNSISEGYVYINKKIRHFSGTSNVTAFPAYLYESNNIEKVPYVDSGDKVGRNIYGCAISTKIPIANDPLTSKAPQYIIISSDNQTKRLKDAFFGQYSLITNPSFPLQVIKKSIQVEENITANKKLISNDCIEVTHGQSHATVYYDSTGNFVIQSKQENTNPYKMIITTNGGFEFYNGEQLIGKIGDTGMNTSASISAKHLKGGNIKIVQDHLYNNDVASDDGTVNINMLGLNDTSNYFRNTKIGDGKGNAIVDINGKNHTVGLNGAVKISSSSNILILHNDTFDKSDPSLVNWITWTDKHNAEVAHIGFLNADRNWHIKNNIGDIALDNTVRITGNLFVNGINITKDLISGTDLESGLGNKADANSVYSIQQTDELFLRKIDAIPTLVNLAGGGKNGQKELCSQMGACSMSTFEWLAVTKGAKLWDMVSFDLPDSHDSSYSTALKERRKEICRNIGAAFVDDVMKNQKDTGWLEVKAGIYNSRVVKVRQIGNTVHMRGLVDVGTHNLHSNMFTLPNSIDPPTSVLGWEFTDNVGYCSYCFEANDRGFKLVTIKPGWQAYAVYFNLTYIV